ncbi:hypothetical protein E4U41_006559 [Claviceps citrina]|nr:hypothetical protein E4U41_006559 [Claviceps citrina]
MANINALSRDERRAIRDETEHDFWQRFNDEHDLHHAKSEARYRTQTSGIKDELTKLSAKRSELADRQERLSAELIQVEKELARVAEACDNKVTMLYTMEQDYRMSEQGELERRGEIVTKMERFFREKQARSRDAMQRPDGQHFHDDLNNTSIRSFSNRDAVHAEAHQQANAVARSTPALLPHTAYPGIPASEFKPASTLVNVVDFDGHVIGPIEEIEPWNPWVEAIQDAPVKRQVKIRRGRKFTQDHLATIYDRSEAKGIKWIACMIQATGQPQEKKCHSCDKNQGVFDDCVILGEPLFQKCGNCEWNRQACHLQITTKTSSENSQRSRRSDVLAFREPPPPARGQLPSLIDRALASHEPNDGLEPLQPPTPRELGFPKHWHQYSQHHPPQKQQHQHQHQHQASSGFTPANLPSRPPPCSREIQTQTMQSAGQADITRSNLVLRHNGVVYTYPECVEGVPLAKIDQSHPYWDPRWPSVESIIAPQLNLWRTKYEEALEKKANGLGGSAKDQTGRQVNRGTTILEFLEYGDISPYQLLSKKYTRTGKGNITAYDTLFRMCKTLGELANFRLDVSPVEWLRHRLHEIILEDGVYFNYFKTMHDFYHDPKLAALREKNGFRSIGRPSGFRAGQSSGEGANDTPSMKKRKRAHSQTHTPRTTPSAGHSPVFPKEEYSWSPISARSNPSALNPVHTLQKHSETWSPVPTGPENEFYTNELGTDTDSWTGAPRQELDWRVYQVKTRLFTSHTNVSQYWHWKEDKRVFKHQVLRDTRPVVSCGLLGDAADFDVPLDDIVQVNWNIGALQVHFVMSSFASSSSMQDGKPRGDVMAAFKRETTMRRFLSYCRQRRLKLSKTAASVCLGSDDMEQRWAEIQLAKLPVADDEGMVCAARLEMEEERAGMAG